MNGQTPLRVLFINENIGGHATVHYHMRKALQSHELITASFFDVPSPSVTRRLVGAAVPLLGRWDLDLQPLRAQLALSAVVRAELKTRINRFDVVHVYTQNAGLLSVGMLGQVPSVVSLDTTNARNAYRLPYRKPTRFTKFSVATSKPFEKRLFSAVDAVVANSNWAAESLTSDYSIDQHKLHVIPFGIEGPKSGGQSAVADRIHALPRIGFVGRQFLAKGGSELLEAFDSSLAGLAELLIVSQETVEERAGVSVVADLVQGDPRLWELLASCEIFAFPSTIDQAPNAVLEAMAAGLPVVAVDTAAVAEMVVEGVTGFLIPPNDPKALAAALLRLVNDPAARRRMGKAGRERFEQHYDVRLGVAKLVEVLFEVATT